MPNGTYGGVGGKETKVGQKTFVSQPTRLMFKKGKEIAIPLFLFFVYLQTREDGWEE